MQFWEGDGNSTFSQWDQGRDMAELPVSGQIAKVEQRCEMMKRLEANRFELGDGLTSGENLVDPRKKKLVFLLLFGNSKGDSCVKTYEKTNRLLKF